MRRAIFLDRDGVLNKAIVHDGKPYPPKDLSEVEILPHVVESVQQLHDAGYFIAVVTNQPDVARGLTEKRVVEEINSFLLSTLLIDEFMTCYHDDIDDCSCRKPRPGAIFAAANKFKIDLAKSYMIGDRWRDIEAGKSAGCKTVFIDYGYVEKKPVSVDLNVASLHEAVRIILDGA